MPALSDENQRMPATSHFAFWAIALVVAAGCGLGAWVQFGSVAAQMATGGALIGFDVGFFIGTGSK